MNKALISLGGNVASTGGSVTATLIRASEMIARSDGVRLLCRSRWYRTPAVPAGSGPDFVNGAALVETVLAPEALLETLHGIEATLGRERSVRWAPRACDLDLLAFDDRILPDRETLERWMALDLGSAQSVVPARLILPHPRMHERGFVLVPLAEIASGWRHPLTGRTVEEMRDSLPADERAAICPLT